MRRLSLTLLVPVLLCACSNTSLNTPSAGQAPGPGQAAAVSPGQWLGGLPLPAGSAIRTEQSLIMGSGETWVGRVALDVGRDADAAYRFFLDSLPAQGWAVVSAVRGRQSLLVMTRQERTLTIEIAEPVLGGPSVWMTMAPRHAQGPAPKNP
jgi:hypothetical protein